MLMGLQWHACSGRNQLTAPVDVFLIRLVTLHGGSLTTGSGLKFWSVARGPRPPQHSMNPTSRGSVGCTACATVLPACSPTSASPLCSAVPSPVPLRGCAQEMSPPWGQAGSGMCPARWRHAAQPSVF